MFALCALIARSPAGPGDTVSVAGVEQNTTPSGASVILTREERQWLSQHDGQVRIGITVIPPQVLRQDGGYEGLSLDYIHLIEHKLGCRFELVPYATWNEVMQAAKAREIDMIFAAQQTPERLQHLQFTRPYIELPNVILVRKDREGECTLPDMKGWSVAVSEGSAVHEYLKREYENLKLCPVPDELTGLRRLSVGEVDAMVVEISRASYYIEKQGILNLRVTGNAGLLYQLRFAVRNDWPLLCGILDKGLGAISEPEKLEINRRWVIVDGGSIWNNKTFRSLLVMALGVILLGGVAVFAWTRTLRRLMKQRTSQLQHELVERKRIENERARMVQQLEAINRLQQSLLKTGPLEDKLTSVTDGVVKQFRADFCRIWIIRPGDLCSQCAHAAATEGPHVCRHREKCLHLLASSGRYTHTNGKDHRRVPFGCYKIGKIASGGEHKFLIPDVVNDPNVHNHDWARELGLVSFAGYQLRPPGGESIGVMALFSRHPIPPSEDAMLDSLGSAVALRVQQAAAEMALRKLNEELEQRVKRRTAELETKNKELEQMLKAFVGRELRMVELKQQLRQQEHAKPGTSQTMDQSL